MKNREKYYVPYFWETLFIDGVETAYEISTHGEIYSLKSKRNMAQEKLKSGYVQVCLYDKSFGSKGKHFLIHRLVAKTFIKNDDPEHKTQVNHIDHNRSNNDANNLEWITPYDNIHDRILRPNRILDEEKAHEICKRLEKGERPKDICKDYGVKEIAIIKIAKGITWRRISKQYNIHLKNYKFKITEKQAIEICERLSKGEKAPDIAKIVGTTEGNIRNIIKGRNWKWISKNYTFAPSGRAKPLSKADVYRICVYLEQKLMTSQEIADEIGTSKAVVDMIRQRKNWTEISKDYDF